MEWGFRDKKYRMQNCVTIEQKNNLKIKYWVVKFMF